MPSKSLLSQNENKASHFQTVTDNQQNPQLQNPSLNTLALQTQPSPPSLAVKARKKVKKNLPVRENLYDKFVEELQRNNWNGTEAMMTVSGAKDRSVAASMAHTYLERYKDLNRIVLEKKGYGLGKMMDIAIRKMEMSATPEWWDRLMRMAGYAEFLPQGQAKGTVAVLTVQKGLIDEYIDGEVIPDK